MALDYSNFREQIHFATVDFLEEELKKIRSYMEDIACSSNELLIEQEIINELNRREISSRG